MRKILAILLISIHLVGNTEAGQLFRLPQLVSHYFQHHRQDPSINFFEFIAMHYAGDDGTKSDDDFDRQLPCHNTSVNTITSVYSPMINDISIINLSLPQVVLYSIHLQSGIPSKHVSLILQPPRQA